MKNINSFKKIAFIALAAVIASSVGVDVNLAKINRADAASCGEDIIVVNAGEVNGITVATALYQTSGACKDGYLYSSDPSLSFGNVYTGGDKCQGETTNSYDTSAFASITTPVDVMVTIIAYGQDYGGECIEHQEYIIFRIMPTAAVPSFTCASNQATATVETGSNTSYTISTTPYNGFNSAVTFTATFSPSTGSTPGITFSNNGRTPPGTTTANISTLGSTTTGTYTINFTASGGGYTATCNTQLVVNAGAPNFNLIVSPSTGILPNINPNRSNIGSNAVFTVFADCIGGFAGPVSSMTASSTFSNDVVTLGATSLACGATTTATISSTAAIPANQQSTVTNIVSENISITGTGQL
jgi:hypothetical protein